MNPTTALNPSLRPLAIELLALDLSTCTPCTGSLSNVEQAIAAVQKVLDRTGTMVQFRKIVVESEAQAKQLQFASSPTIRINGRDITLETTEGRCGDCSAISGSSMLCRTWLYQGKSYTEAPVGLIADAILREIEQNEAPTLTVSNAFEVPQNLQQFFQNKAKEATSRKKDQTVAAGCGCGCS